MKQKQMTLIAVGCGVACATCVGAFMASVQGAADSARAEALARFGGEQVEVCVATRDIAPGERVDLSAIETKLWIADLLPEGSMQSSADIAGQVATSAIIKGEVISSKRFESERASLEVPAGKEAVSVPAKTVQAVGGAIRAGMSVDVYSSGSSGTSLIAGNVVVLDTSMGDSGFITSSDTGWITLGVEPEKVQELVAASNKTTLYFVLPGSSPDAAANNAEAESTPESAAPAQPEQNPSATASEKDTEGKSQNASSSAAANRKGEGD